MKQLSFCLVLLLFLSKPATAQTKTQSIQVIAGPFAIPAEKQKAVWYYWEGATKREWATSLTTVQPNYQGDKLLFIQELTSKGASGPTQIDTTVVLQETLVPVYYTSSNLQRTIHLTFSGQEMNASVHDHKTMRETSERETVAVPTVSSSFYPLLIRFLPLKVSYQATIPIFDVTLGRRGLLTARIIGVSETQLTDTKGERITCYVVDVNDDIAPDAHTTYYISKKDRTRIKSETIINGLRMSVERP
ncbi:hypothetical protein ACFQ4C_28530 [Larkinella insperata]|uniref:DUF3108 domain-containing protein n=1 Tax=Larkinella insperata TaxID=332158 RepID=A0ABW3QHN2_9BACT|nr:hypothetical protein [Larkinella insperata]